MKKMFCPECREEIGIDYVHPTKSFLMTDEGKFERNDNNLSDDPYLEFYCTNDREHDIDTKEVMDWEIEVEDEFKRQGMYDK
jgi:hypothetical protein